MDKRRFVLAEVTDGSVVRTWSMVLPDAEHLHITRNSDGSIAHAVPMEEAGVFSPVGVPLGLWAKATAHEKDRPLWVDAPVQGDDREDRRPHSRACGWRPHPHGRECSTNCPTCHGIPVQGDDRG